MILAPLKTYNLSGIWSVSTGDGKTYNMRLPGTLDENNIGYPDTLAPLEERIQTPEPETDPLDRLLTDDEEEISFEAEQPETEDYTVLTRLTRKYTYEGAVRISRMTAFHETPGKRLFLETERARVLSLFIDGEEVEPYIGPTLSTVQVFEVTGLLDGNHMITLVSDNRYPGLPREEILASNAASDDSQTNWNGLLGYVRLREEESVFIERVLVRTEKNAASVYVEISAPARTEEEPEIEAQLRFSSPVLTHDYEQAIKIQKEYTGFLFEGLELNEFSLRWDEEDGHLYAFSAFLNGQEKTTFFGIREFTAGKLGKFLLNRRILFLRGETNRAVCPETSHVPMDRNSWKKFFEKYRACGLNLVRFESYCPPEEAFTAADEMGLLLMPELSIGCGVTAFETEEAQDYYKLELSQILRSYGNHPSFVMLSLGHELQLSEAGQAYAEKLLQFAVALDHTRVYLLNDQVYMPETGGKAPELKCRTLTREILPDFREIDLYSGFLEPNHLVRMRDLAAEKGLTANWNRYVEASGEAALIRLKDQIEADILKEDCAGLLFTGLQDFPGKGGIFTGTLNSHMQFKPFGFADPKRLNACLGSVVLLAETERRSYEYGETVQARISVANFSKEAVENAVFWSFTGGEFAVRDALRGERCPAGTVTMLGSIRIELAGDELNTEKPERFTLSLRMGKVENSCSFYAFPAVLPICPTDVLETDALTDSALEYLSQGGTVFFTPPSEETYFTASVPMEETRGQYADLKHPLFEGLPLREYADEFWEHLDSGCSVILPRRTRALIYEMDDPIENRLLARLTEFRCGGGNVLLSTLGLKEKIEYPEVRAFLSAVYTYLDSYDFSPSQEIKPEDLKQIVISR